LPDAVNLVTFLADNRGKEVAMKMAAIFVVVYLLLGAVVCDFQLHGHMTAHFGQQLLIAGAILGALFLIGWRLTRRHNRFIGLSHWQWGILPPLAIAAGVALRFYAL
jgi:hypothetical protein